MGTARGTASAAAFDAAGRWRWQTASLTSIVPSVRPGESIRLTEVNCFSFEELISVRMFATTCSPTLSTPCSHAGAKQRLRVFRSVQFSSGVLDGEATQLRGA